MVGGAGDLSGVPRHICQLSGALQGIAKITVISDVNHSGYDELPQFGVKNIIIRGLANRSKISGFLALLKALRVVHTDIVWLHAPMPALIARCAYNLRIWKPRCPVLLTYHAQGFAKSQPRVVRVLMRYLERAVLATCPPHHIIFLSKTMQAKTQQSIGHRIMARHTAYVVPNCANICPLPANQKSGTRTLIMTGRVSRQKHHERALRLFDALPPDTHLLLCGPGTDTANFRQMARATVQKQTLNRITFAGPVRDIRPLLAKADAYLLTSRYEGQPIGALEAFEAGLPIILSDFEGASDLTTLHPCSHLLNPNDPTQDAKHIIKLINRFRDDEADLRIKINAIWRAHWSPEVFGDNYRALLRNILSDASKHEQPDSLHDAPIPHPHHCRNAIDPPPALLP
jgi:glycosyltransferase involved in cell wall biosynthesis